MYAIYTYIDPSNHPNVGIYGIHGVFGNESGNEQHGATKIIFETDLGKRRVSWVLVNLLIRAVLLGSSLAQDFRGPRMDGA